MGARQRAAEAARRLGKAAPAGIRGQAGRATRRFRPGWSGPLVTVVLPVSDADTTRIGPCLDDLRNQLYRNLEIRVQPWGPCEQVRRIAQEHADADWRVVVARRTATDAAAARNAAAARARGTYLLFVGGGDSLPPRGVGRLVRVLERTGSDLAVGRLRPPPGPGRRVDSPFEAAHHTEVTGTDLSSSPVAVTDLGLGNRMFRRSFWRASQLRFSADRPDGVDVALASYAAAGRFDLLAEDTYIPANRRDGVSVGSMPEVLSGLGTWIDEHERTWEELRELDLPDVSDWWLWGVLDTAIQPFVEDAERATDEQWRQLRDHVELLLETAGESAWAALRSESRVKLWLLRADRRAELEDYVIRRLFDKGDRPTRVQEGRVLADLPFRGDPAVGVPEDCYLMTEAETPLVVEVRGLRWSGPGRLQVDLLAYVDHVGMTTPPEVAVRLVHPGAGAVDLPVRQYADLTVNHRPTARRYQDFSLGCLAVEVDTAALAAATADRPGEAQRWRLEVTLTTQGITRSGGVTGLDERGTAGLLDSGHLAPQRHPTPHGDLLVGPVAEAFGVAVEVRPDTGPRLLEATVEGRRVRGVLDPRGTAVRGVRVRKGGPDGRAPVRRDGDLLRFDLEVPLPWIGAEHVRWVLTAEAEGGRELPIGWGPREQWLGEGAGSVVLNRSATGSTDVLESAATLVLDHLDLVDGAVEVAGRWLGEPPATGVRLSLVEQARISVDLPSATGPDRQVSARLPLRWDPWQLGELPVPAVRYLFELEGDLVPTARVLLGGAVLDRLLTWTVGDDYRFRPVRQLGRAGIQLLPPLDDDERGVFAQTSMQHWLVTTDEPVDQQVVYLQSYTGHSATDSQVAIHEELRRRHPELRLHWGVADRSSWVPEGGIPVLMYSREWYRVLATAGTLCLNIDFDRWFVKRPGQRVLQTFHGYPAKSMGIRMWEAKGYTPRRVEAELARTSHDWDLILTPAPEMDVHYRREYRYDGPIHSAGYPRDDLLLSPDADAVREDTRRRLGIRPGQKAVLYAPTWRDDLAITWRTAEMVHHLDVETASRRLGPDYVMLMRGHRFHQRPEARAGGARMIDVTGYPEINHLILAADAAVLDYSSLRFDFALTGRPMIFLVPDLAAYTGGVRGFLYPFEESAPGPLVDTADEVIELLRQLPALTRDHAEELERFNQRYNYLQDGHSAERVVKAFWG